MATIEQGAPASKPCRCGGRASVPGGTSQCTPNPLASFEEHRRFTNEDLRALDLLELLVEEHRALTALAQCRDDRARRWWRQRFTRARALRVARRSGLRSVPVAGRGRG